MRALPGSAIALLLAACSVIAQAQQRHHKTADVRLSKPVLTAEHTQDEGSDLTLDDRLSVIAAALDARVRSRSERDCSHLVHAIYEQAGFPYVYAPSSDLYRGTDGFQRIQTPEPGDLVVWRGHVGIVVKPSQHLFFSFLRSGPGIDDWEAAYWKKRGRARFYRYNIASCASCDSTQHAAQPLLRINEKH